MPPRLPHGAQFCRRGLLHGQRLRVSSLDIADYFHELRDVEATPAGPPLTAATFRSAGFEPGAGFVDGALVQLCLITVQLGDRNANTIQPSEDLFPKKAETKPGEKADEPALRPLRVMDVFAGVGGLSIGLEQG